MSARSLATKTLTRPRPTLPTYLPILRSLLPYPLTFPLHSKQPKSIALTTFQRPLRVRYTSATKRSQSFATFLPPWRRKFHSLPQTLLYRYLLSPSIASIVLPVGYDRPARTPTRPPACHMIPHAGRITWIIWWDNFFFFSFFYGVGGGGCV